MIKSWIAAYAKKLRSLTQAPPGGQICLESAAQLNLKFTYQALAQSKAPLPRLSDVGFKVFSQTDEDGILLYLFSLLKEKNRRCVEICAGNGIECNTANLLIHHGWDGLLLDGNAGRVEEGRAFYRAHPNTYVCPPVFACEWITRDNVNDILSRHGFTGDIDLLSLDMDGMDYWIWKSLETIRPRVVVLEYQDILGPERSVSVPYTDRFNAFEHPTTEGAPNYCGASLMAFTKLAAAKGYRLAGCNNLGFNAFFIRNGEGEDFFPAIPVSDCFQHRKVQQGMTDRFPSVERLPWVEV